MTRTLLSLPSETILAIASYLNSAADYRHFSFACKSIRRILDNEHTIAQTLKRVAGHTVEYELATSGKLSAKAAIRKLYDRQQAFTTSKPASTIMLGDGSSFLYRQGLLAYVRGRFVRVLNVHEASWKEGVVVSDLVGPKIFGTECKDTEIELCHLQDGLLSIMFHGETVRMGWRSWLLVVDVDQDKSERERVQLKVDLWTPEDVIVRNSRRYLCAMSPTGASVNGRHREWVCKIWDLEDPAPRPAVLQIPDLAVGEIGQGLVFEVFDGFLYAISTQAPYELEEPEWTSYYTCFRFPLENPGSRTLETLRIWRRHHKEGPINDLWTDLKLHKDETTGELFIMEARKEWTGGSSVQKRTWYRQALPPRFLSPEGTDNDGDEEMIDVNNQSNNLQQDISVNDPQNLVSSSTSAQDPPYLLARPPDDDEWDYDPFTTATSLAQRPSHPRLPHNTHPEYPVDAPVPPIVDSFILAKSKHRAYNPSAAAFLDLVVDDRQPSTQRVQQIRFRIGSRCEASPLDQNGMIHGHHVSGHNGKPVPDSERRYVDQGIHIWPPADAPVVLQGLLNGNVISSDLSSDRTGCRTLGDICAISDERSIIYLVKEKGAADADKGQLILVNFDEHIRFFYEEWAPGFIDLYGHRNTDQNTSSNEPAEQITNEGMLKRTYEPMVLDTDEVEEEASKDKEAEKKSSNENDGNDINKYSLCKEVDEDESVDLNWFRKVGALWIDIQKGFCFV
ncbi:MAG: hypothetical protein Q9225_004865 [Loekoesia sp. 1 TL-2023]